MSEKPEPIACHYCVETPALRAIEVYYNTPRKTGVHRMYRMECACGTIGKCRPTPKTATEAWNEQWQARVGKEYLTVESEGL